MYGGLHHTLVSLVALAVVNVEDAEVEAVCVELCLALFLWLAAPECDDGLGWLG